MFRSYTPSEKRRRAGLVLRGSRQALADCVDPRIETAIDRIDAAAEERGYREAKALHNELEAARNAVATAKAKERIAPREDRRDARQAREAAEKTLRRTETAARRFGL